MEPGLILSIASTTLTALVLILLIVVLVQLARHGSDLVALSALSRGATRPETEPEDEENPRPDGEHGTRLGKVAVVMNPVKFADAESFRRRITEVVDSLEEAEVVFYETTVEDAGQGQARQAVTEGADLVVAAGGDGTVRMVASVLAGTDTRMGIIPAGTGNLLARNVDIPLDDPGSAMIAALTGRDRMIDVGWLQAGNTIASASASAPQIFLVIAGFGADAEMIGHTDSTMKKRIGWMAYVFGGARTILGRSVDVVVDVGDGVRHAHRARTVLLGNVGKLPGGLVLMPDATVDNGTLEIMVAGWRGAAGFSQVVTQILNPRLVPQKRPRFATQLSTMERYQTTSVKVATTKEQPVQLDGDTDIEATHMIARVDPGTLRLRVPVSPRSTTV